MAAHANIRLLLCRMEAKMLKQRLAHFRNAVKSAPLAYIPGHYYSPICDPIKIQRWYQDPAISHHEAVLPGIDLRRDPQLARLCSWRDHIATMEFCEKRSPGRRYYYGGANNQYPLGDAVSLCAFIRELRPKRYVEIGSGFSSVCALDAIDQLLLDTQCTFIDPEPQRLQTLLRSPETRSFTLLPQMVQDVPCQIYEELEEGDILLIDSSHVIKTASDVEFELFSILPRLRPGVFIHIHDIFYPFEYPAEWAVNRNYSWNEIYALRSFLMYNNRFRIEFWNDYLVKTAAEAITSSAPVMMQHPGGSLWLSVTDGTSDQRRADREEAG